MRSLHTIRLLSAGLLLLAGVPEIRAQSVRLSVLHQFTAGVNDGASPYSEVILGSDGVLYGTTWSGGTNAAGTVFRMNRDGSGFSAIHHFGNASDGATPFDGVIQGADGFLYGTTFYGGTNSNGTIFKINTNGSIYSILYSFTNSPDGGNPYGGLVQGQDDALYGTTENGGTGPGTIFKIGTNGDNYAVLHSFTNSTDAVQPFGRLVQASNGLLYGTTVAGGVKFVGAVFQIDTNGQNYSVIHSFNGFSEGFSPECGLLVGQDGWLYGTAVSGGTSGSGTVFKLNTNGSGYTVLRSFTNSPDGAHSYSRVTQGVDGYLYGVTSSGGNTGMGTIFRVTTNGTDYSVLYSFHGAGDGRIPNAGLFATTNGSFYGTALMGGNTNSGFGTVYGFTLVPALNLNFSNPSAPSLTLTGFANQSCQVQVSSNLINWDFLANVVLTNGSAQIMDAIAPQTGGRFYRAIIP